MIIPAEILSVWKELKSDGDFRELNENNPNHSKETFRLVFVNGKCGDAVFAIMSDFYKKKVEMIVDAKNALSALQ